MIMRDPEEDKDTWLTLPLDLPLGTLIRPEVTQMRGTEAQRLKRWERRVLSATYGGVNTDDVWKSRASKETAESRVILNH